MTEKIVNFFKGENPFTNRETTIYGDDGNLAEEVVRKAYRNQISSLKRTDYTGFCADVKFDHIVGLVKLGELAEDTDTLRVWCHRVPVQGNIFKRWETRVEVTPLSTKKASELVYTCDQVERYGCPTAIMPRMMDFDEAACAIA